MQGVLETVQRKVTGEAVTVTVVMGDKLFEIVAEPLTTVHRPVPTEGVFAAIVNILLHAIWSAPAFAIVGAPIIVTVVVVFAEQPLFVTVKVMVLVPEVLYDTAIGPIVEPVAGVAFAPKFHA